MSGVLYSYVKKLNAIAKAKFDNMTQRNIPFNDNASNTAHSVNDNNVAVTIGQRLPSMNTVIRPRVKNGSAMDANATPNGIG